MALEGVALMENQTKAVGSLFSLVLSDFPFKWLQETLIHFTFIFVYIAATIAYRNSI